MGRNLNGHLLIFAVTVLLISLLAPSAVLAQTVTISGGNINLTFSAPVAGSDLSDVVNTSCGLSWNRPGGQGNTIITVRTNAGSSTATLTIEAINVSGGSSAGTVTLGNQAQNLVTGIAFGDGGCDLEYTASASLTDGTLTEPHTITFTITE